MALKVFIHLLLESRNKSENCPLSELLLIVLESQSSTYVQQESHSLCLPAQGSFMQGSSSFGLSVDVDTRLDQQPDSRGQKEGKVSQSPRKHSVTEERQRRGGKPTLKQVCDGEKWS